MGAVRDFCHMVCGDREAILYDFPVDCDLDALQATAGFVVFCC